jgi:hypothetical protein
MAGIAARRDCRSGHYRAWGWVPIIGRILQNECEGGHVSTLTYVYEIDTALARNALHVPSELRDDRSISELMRQDEWAFIHWIPPYAIRGVRVYHARASQAHGFLTSRATITFDRYVPNGAMCEATAISVRSPASVNTATPSGQRLRKASGTQDRAIHTTSPQRGSCQSFLPTAVAAVAITISGTAGSASLMRSWRVSHCRHTMGSSIPSL